MSPRRLSLLAAAYGTVAVAGWVAAGLGGLGSPGIESTGAPTEDSRATSVTAQPSTSTRCKQPQWARTVSPLPIRGAAVPLRPALLDATARGAARAVRGGESG